jgi:hypothetical protein
MADRTHEFNVKLSACAAIYWAEGHHLTNGFAVESLKDNALRPRFNGDPLSDMLKGERLARERPHRRRSMHIVY